MTTPEILASDAMVCDHNEQWMHELVIYIALRDNEVILCYHLLQIQISVPWQMEAVIKTVLTLSLVMSVPVTLGICSTVMEDHVMVSILCLNL